MSPSAMPSTPMNFNTSSTPPLVMYHDQSQTFDETPSSFYACDDPFIPVYSNESDSIPWFMAHNYFPSYHFDVLNDDPKNYDLRFNLGKHMNDGIPVTPSPHNWQQNAVSPESSPFRSPMMNISSPLDSFIIATPISFSPINSSDDPFSPYPITESRNELRLEAWNLPEPVCNSGSFCDIPIEKDEKDSREKSAGITEKSPWAGRLRERKARSIILTRKYTKKANCAVVPRMSSPIDIMECRSDVQREMSPMSDLTELDSESDVEDEVPHRLFLSRARATIERLSDGSEDTESSSRRFCIRLRSQAKKLEHLTSTSSDTDSRVLRNRTVPRDLKTVGKSPKKYHPYARDDDLLQCLAKKRAENAKDYICPVAGCAQNCRKIGSFMRHILAHSKVAEIFCVCRNSEGKRCSYARIDSMRRHAQISGDRDCLARVKEAEAEEELFCEMQRKLKEFMRKPDLMGNVQAILEETMRFRRQCQERVI